MTQIPYTITSSGISVLIDSRMRVVPVGSVNFDLLRLTLRHPPHDLELIRDLVDLKRFIAKATVGAVEVSDDEVRFHGTRVGNVVADRILGILKAGEDIAPMAHFLAKLLANPLQSAIDEMYLWLESGNMPITPEGNFIAFKKVRPDYMDIYSGTISYAVGEQPMMERDEVDPDRNNTCSRGLHFASWSYLPSYSGGTGSKVMIVEVDPADVVAIPSDYRNAKGRAWTMKVIGEVPEDECQHLFDNKLIYRTQDGAVVDRAVVDRAVDDGDVSEDEEDYCPECGEEALNCECPEAPAEADEVDVFSQVSDAVTEALSVIEDPSAIQVAQAVVDAMHAAGHDVTGSELRVVKMSDDGVVFDTTFDIVDDVDGDVPETEDVSVAEAEAPATQEETVQEPAPEETFDFHGQTYTREELSDLVQKHGQRGFSRLSGIARTTLQGWLSKAQGG